MTYRWLAVLPALAMIAGPSFAQHRPAPATPVAEVATDPSEPQPLDDAALQALNGREGVVIVVATSEQLLHATNSGNSVNGQIIGSGDLTIGAGAFSGFNGIGNFVMNSGHNNNLQGAITINIATGAPTP